MEELIQYLKETRMEGLKGMKIEGEVPVSEKQLNVLLEQFVRPQLEPKAASATGDSSPAAGNPMVELLPFLKFPVLEIKVKENKVVLKLKVEV